MLAAVLAVGGNGEGIGSSSLIKILGWRSSLGGKVTGSLKRVQSVMGRIK